MTEKEMLEVFEAKRAELFARLAEEMTLWTKAMGRDDVQVADIHNYNAHQIRKTLTKVYGINF
jgi:hypothetical protein